MLAVYAMAQERFMNVDAPISRRVIVIVRGARRTPWEFVAVLVRQTQTTMAFVMMSIPASGNWTLVVFAMAQVQTRATIAMESV
jgi:hypothetical protein